jgi:microcystin-dependent protein
MSNPFIGEIRMFGGGFAPNNWALCNGALMSISQNSQLFTVLGTSYGGNGTTTFQLPNLLDNVPLGAGAGGGLSVYAVGQAVGAPTVTLVADQMSNHTHKMMANFNVGDLKAPTTLTAIAQSNPAFAYAPDDGTKFDAMDASCLTGFTGQGQPHNNIQPYLAVNFIIALQGIYPSRQ